MFKLEFLQNSKLVLTFDLLVFRDLVRWFWLPFCATLFGMFGLGPTNGPSRARESRHQWSQQTPEPQRHHRPRCTVPGLRLVFLGYICQTNAYWDYTSKCIGKSNFAE